MIVNLTKMRCLSREPFYAVSPGARLRGMIGKRFDGFDSMVFQRCRAIHTMFMLMPIDVIFVDRANTVCAVHRELPPWLPMIFSRRAIATVELPAGVLAATGTEIGDKIDLNSELTGDIIQEMQENVLEVRGVYHCKENGK
jgi:hypothetical protein